jgi:ATP-dependent helicase/nuclease subunit A
VDEFQDTDPLQAEIVFYLAERPESVAEAWDDAELVPGKLFIVGDPKQSIYRFRRADLDLYGKVRAKIEACGQCQHIRMNFRSVPDILHEVNDVFAAHMTGERNGRYEPEYVALEPYHEALSKRPQTVFLSPPEGWWGNKPDARHQARAEAACIAEYIREQVVEKHASYRDIGILYSATTHLSELENALRSREIPYQVAGGKKLIERAEILALRTVIAALDNPFDEVSVVGALRSPFFACSDEDLLVQRLDGGGFHYVCASGALPHVESGFSILRDLHQTRSQRAPSQTIADLFARTKGLQIYALKPQGPGRVANLLKLLDIARALESGPASSFHSLARRLGSLEDLSAGEDDSATAETGDDVVQLLTFHKAKGLEFPVVILFRLGHTNVQQEGPIISRKTKAIQFSAKKGLATAGFRAAKEDERDREHCEAMRLLYVAMTRACRQLVIPAYWCDATKGFYDLLRLRYTPRGQKPAMEDTRFTIHDTSGYSLDVPPTEALRMALDLPESDPLVQASLAKKAVWAQERSIAADRLTRASHFATPSRTAQDRAFDRDQPGQRDAANFGSYVHRVLEQVNLADGINLDAICRMAAEEFEIHGDRIQEGRELVRHALQSDLVRRATRAEAMYREVPFVDLQDGVLWEGVIDLLFVERGRLVIVDFKTDAIPASEAALRVQDHAPQMQAYRRAMERITGKPVAELLVYYLRANVVSPVMDTTPTP